MNAAAIRANMNELKSITTEMKKLQSQIKVLKDRKTQVESKLVDYLKTLPDDDETKGIKFRDMTVFLKERKTHQRAKKEDVSQNVYNILSSSGVKNPEEVYKKLKDSMKGKEERKAGLKIQQESENNIKSID
jgi:hypothetical protein